MQQARVLCMLPDKVVLVDHVWLAFSDKGEMQEHKYRLLCWHSNKGFVRRVRVPPIPQDGSQSSICVCTRTTARELDEGIQPAECAKCALIFFPTKRAARLSCLRLLA